MGSALRKVLRDKPSLEVEKQVEWLLSRIDEKPSPNHLRALRATGVLECIGTPEAKRLLETLAGGDPEVFLTREAKASLERLSLRAESGR